MSTYEETMRAGAERYAEPIQALLQAGWDAEFTQTGGMSAAILVKLDVDRYVLVTDAEDTLSWRREDQIGWGVGYFVNNEHHDRPEFEGALAYESEAEATDTESLLRLVDDVVREGTASFARVLNKG